MTEGIWIAVIAAVQAVSLGVLGKVSFDSSRSRKQVENSHITPTGEPYNLRDNIDANHLEVLNAVGRVERDVSGMKRDIGRLDDRDLAHGKHHERTDQKFDDLTKKLDLHLEQVQSTEGR